MYKVIEGKKFLIVLYVISLFLGTVLMNLIFKMGWMQAYDLFDGIEYVKTMSQLDHYSFFSDIFWIRLKQLVLFFIAMLLFSPYVVFCMIDCLFSVLIGGFLSAMTVQYGWSGSVKGICFLFPQYICYLGIFILIYKHLFGVLEESQYTSAFYGSARIAHAFYGKKGKELKQRIVVVLSVILLFLLGCYAEANLNPLFLQMIRL